MCPNRPVQGRPRVRGSTRWTRISLSCKGSAQRLRAHRRTAVSSDRYRHKSDIDRTSSRSDRNTEIPPTCEEQGVFQWSQLGSNQRPSACEADALPLSYETGIRSAASFEALRTRWNLNTHHPPAAKSPPCHSVRRTRPVLPGHSYATEAATEAVHRQRPRETTALPLPVNHTIVIHALLPGDL